MFLCWSGVDTLVKLMLEYGIKRLWDVVKCLVVELYQQAPHLGKCLLCKIYKNVLASISSVGTDYVIFSGSHSPIWKKKTFFAVSHKYFASSTVFNHLAE